MYEDIRQALEKTQGAIPNLHAYKRAAMAGTVLPTGDRLDTFLPTFIYIATVSILDDALEALIGVEYPSSDGGTLGARISFLRNKGRLMNADRLDDIREARNRYAHEPEVYASWEELMAMLSDVREELAHLGVL